MALGFLSIIFVGLVGVIFSEIMKSGEVNVAVDNVARPR